MELSRKILEMELSSPKIKKNLIFSKKNLFLYFGKRNFPIFLLSCKNSRSLGFLLFVSLTWLTNKSSIMNLLPNDITSCSFAILPPCNLCTCNDFSIFPCRFKGALSGLRRFLATESPLKMMKNGFYFTLKALFVLEIFKCLSRLFGHV